MTAAVALLSAVEARALTAAIRVDLAGAVTGLRRAIDAGAPAALGYDTAWAWAHAELGDLLRELKLPRPVRLHLVEAMDAAGMTVREIADELGVSLGTAQNDRTALGKVIPIGPRRRGTGLPAPTGKLWQQAAEWLRRAGHGLTLVELAAVMGITEGSASGLLSDVCRRGLATRTEDRRAGQRVHVVR